MVAQIDSNYKKLSYKRSLVRLISYLFYEGRPLTTKGRWFNKVIFPLLKTQALINSKSNYTPVFILGTGRSGTTILGVTLSLHSEVGFLNEPKAVWSLVKKNEDLIGSYNNDDAKYILGSDDVDSDESRIIRNIYSCYSKVTGSSIVLDKYPELIFRVPFVKKIFPNAKFIFLYRNGWDTCFSIDLWSKRLGVNQNGEVHDWWGKDNRKWKCLIDEVCSSDDKLSPYIDKIRDYNDHSIMAAVEWILTMKQGLRLKDRSDTLMLKYEDFVSSSDTRNTVLSFCGLDSEPAFENYCAMNLSRPKKKNEISLPEEIVDEFNNLMRELGYE